MNQNQIIECVPNFSEGRDMTIIKQITDEIEKTDGVSHQKSSRTHRYVQTQR